MKSFAKYLFITLIILSSNSITATEKYLELNGWVEAPVEKLKDGTVEIYKNDSLIGEISVNRWGNWYLELPMNSDYLLIVKHPETADKRVLFHLPEDKYLPDELYFEFIVELNPKGTSIGTKYFTHTFIWNPYEMYFVYDQPKTN